MIECSSDFPIINDKNPHNDIGMHEEEEDIETWASEDVSNFSDTN